MRVLQQVAEGAAASIAPCTDRWSSTHGAHVWSHVPAFPCVNVPVNVGCVASAIRREALVRQQQTKQWFWFAALVVGPRMQLHSRETGSRQRVYCTTQVPYTLVDEDIPDDWACEHNAWDPEHQSCAVPQALSDERIDEILLQQVQLEVRSGSVCAWSDSCRECRAPVAR